MYKYCTNNHLLNAVNCDCFGGFAEEENQIKDI